jgi:hypothetical protein
MGNVPAGIASDPSVTDTAAQTAVTNPRGTEETEAARRALSAAVVGAAIEVHRRLGPGLLEVDCSYRADLIVDDVLMVEVKSVESLIEMPLRRCRRTSESRDVATGTHRPRHPAPFSRD